MNLELTRDIELRVRELAARYDAILGQYWVKSRGTFSIEGDENDSANHVTTSCTCVLTFIDSADSSAPNFFAKDRFVDWLLSADTPWTSEGMPEPNAYSAPIALTALAALAPDRLGEPRPVAAMEYLLDRLKASGGGVSLIDDKEPSGFLTYWTVRALWDLANGSTNPAAGGLLTPKARATAQIRLSAARSWAQQEILRQVAYHGLRDYDRFDPLQLAYAMAIVDFIRDRTGQDPDLSGLSAGLALFFDAQMPNGLWPKGAPLFHSQARGSVYAFSLETLTAVMRIGARRATRVIGARRRATDETVEIFGQHLERLLATLEWVASHELLVAGRTGWRSNHVAVEGPPQAWSTAMVLGFARGLYRLMRRILHAEVLEQFGASYPLLEDPPTGDTWTKVTGASTQVAGVEIPVHQLLWERVIEPHLAQPVMSSKPAVAPIKPRGVILSGPPGTAKTTLANDIAAALAWPLISLGTSDFLELGSDMVPHRARLIFQRLEQLTQAIVFIDEVDPFVQTRTKTDPASRLITTAMLTLIQDLRKRESTILILATNNIDEFDPAIRRYGRFDLIVTVMPPGFEAKLDQLRDSAERASLRLSSDDAARALAKHRELVERFTFLEWKSLVSRFASRLPGPDFPLDDFVVAVVATRDQLVIEHNEFDKWKDRPSYAF